MDETLSIKKSEGDVKIIFGNKHFLKELEDLSEKERQLFILFPETFGGGFAIYSKDEDEKNRYKISNRGDIEFNRIDELKDEKSDNIDGVLTDERDIKFVLRTFDSLPLFFYDPKNNVIAAIHCGRDALINGVISNFFAKLQKFYTDKKLEYNKENFKFVFGPGLRIQNHQVRGIDIKNLLELDKNNNLDLLKFFYQKTDIQGGIGFDSIEKVLAQDQQSQSKNDFLHFHQENHFYFDPVEMTKVLIEKEIGEKLDKKNIYDCEICTKENSAFKSKRRWDDLFNKIDKIYNEKKEDANIIKLIEDYLLVKLTYYKKNNNDNKYQQEYKREFYSENFLIECKLNNHKFLYEKIKNLKKLNEEIIDLAKNIFINDVCEYIENLSPDSIEKFKQKSEENQFDKQDFKSREELIEFIKESLNKDKNQIIDEFLFRIRLYLNNNREKNILYESNLNIITLSSGFSDCKSIGK